MFKQVIKLSDMQKSSLPLMVYTHQHYAVNFLYWFISRELTQPISSCKIDQTYY